MNNCVECKTGNATHAGKKLCESCFREMLSNKL
jgi:ribosomal protein S14